MKGFVRAKFDSMAEWTALNAGSPVTFAVAVSMVLAWGSTGPLFGFSETWQLIINTATTIATFLMVFLLQNSSNRNNEELRELVRTMADANRKLLEKLDDIEDMVDEE